MIFLPSLLSLISLVLAAPPPAPAPAGCSTSYTIQSGDTCLPIASAFNIPLSQLTSLNPTTSCTNLKIGHTLCLPNPITCASGLVVHPIVSGDICYNLKGALTLAAFNTNNPTLNCNNLQVGNIACVAPVSVLPNYVVKSGDYCSAIANKYNTQVTVLQTLNTGLNCNNLQINQKIAVPKAITCGTHQTAKTVASTSPATTCFGLIQNIPGSTWTLGNLYYNNPTVNCAALQIGNTVCVPMASVGRHMRQV